eukprot:8494666-Alexandrium_andersonii.AAC.1
MEALFASCSGEFQNIRNAQTQQAAATQGLRTEIRALSQKLLDLDPTITQQLQIINARISALENRPVGVPLAPTGGAPNPVGLPPVPTGEAAAGAG